MKFKDMLRDQILILDIRKVYLEAGADVLDMNLGKKCP